MTWTRERVRRVEIQLTILDVMRLQIDAQAPEFIDSKPTEA